MGLSRRASQLPLTAISFGLEAWERSRGLREFALRRGNEALQIAAHTPLGRLIPQRVHDDGADDEAARIVAEVREQPAPVKPAAPEAETPEAAAAKPVQPPVDLEAARAVGAPGAVADEVDKIADTVHVDAPEHREELPIPDFDNISIGSLRARLRSLSVQQLVVLREWEQAHAHRLNVLTTLDNRIAKLAEETGATATPRQSDVGAAGTDYPREAKAAERAAEAEGGTLRI
jgi:hypothetical protein